VTEIMQESTDAIYKFEDDAITIADKILKNILKNEIFFILKECAD
jgi:F0F1-type ATP synthase gamma subunit